jgi:carboxymethylenebutenolidase
MDHLKASDFDQEVLDLFDKYVHGIIERREFLDKAAKFAVGGVTATGLLTALSPSYALAKQVEENDSRIRGMDIKYDSPKGHGSINGYLARPIGGGKRGGLSSS